MIVACLPGYCAASCNLYELELDSLPGRHARVQEPVRIVRWEHWTDRPVPGRAPIAQFNCVTGEKNIVTSLRRRRVVNCKGDRNQFRGQQGVLNNVRNLTRRIDYGDIVDAVGRRRCGAHDLSWRP